MTGHDDPVPVRPEPHPADERLAVLRVDRPPVNAFDQRMWDLFDAVTASLHGDTLYRAVVITGGPRHFAAGADVKGLLELGPGRTVTADEALAIGLADRVVEDAGLLDATVTEALRYARGPLALRHAKQAVDAALELPAEDGLALEADLISRCYASEDGQRGLRSFVEEGPRKATFLGR
jgi:enoyl-CoA hydratase/carnithine racemase